MAEEKKLNEDMTKLLPKLVCKCESKIEALNHEYSSMTIEDSNYHAEKRRHHSNHDD